MRLELTLWVESEDRPLPCRHISQAHWLFDVIAGWALGAAAGCWATRRELLFFVELLPHDAAVGFAAKF